MSGASISKKERDLACNGLLQIIEVDGLKLFLVSDVSVHGERVRLILLLGSALKPSNGNLLGSSWSAL
jgi:hypothetical protein